jgi:hypothetical protein
MTPRKKIKLGRETTDSERIDMNLFNFEEEDSKQPFTPSHFNNSLSKKKTNK